MQSRLASNNPAGVRKPPRRDGRTLAGGRARPPLPSGTPGTGTGQTNASRRDARKAILNTVPAGTSSSPTVGAGIPASNAARPAMDLRQRQAQFRSKALLLCKAEGPKFIEEKSTSELRSAFTFWERSRKSRLTAVSAHSPQPTAYSPQPASTPVSLRPGARARGPAPPVWPPARGRRPPQAGPGLRR